MNEKFSIWIIPPKGIKDKYSDIINKLSQKYKSPSFIPHITLLPILQGNFENIKDRIEKLVLGTKPFKIRLNTISHTDSYYKSLFINVTKSNRLDSLFETFYKSFKKVLVNVDENYMPHLSLMYGNFPEITKTEIIKKLKNANFKEEFIVDRLFLVSIKLEEWKVIKNFRFKTLNSLRE